MPLPKLSFMKYFYVVFTARAMLSRYMPWPCVCLCPSQVGVLLKWLNIGTRKQRHTIAQGLYFSGAKNIFEIRTGSPPTGAPNAGGVGRSYKFRQITHCISKTVQERHIVSIKDE